MRKSYNPKVENYFYLYSFFRRITPISVMLLPILIDNNLGISDFFFFTFIFRLTQFLTEVPTAYLADNHGKRNSLIISTLFMLIAIIFLLFKQNYIFLLFFQVFRYNRP